ncbi:MAG: TIM barrel protein [Mesorhizobium sp.]|nr:TIM barrel protein [Mesorhizobium sp.]MCO5162567.1 TIM barrel protein [Mesorhizobium sp.]
MAFTRSAKGKSRMAIMEWLATQGLDALELQMTYGPRTKPETCRELRAVAADHGIRLSVHASYFIVLTSDDPQKVRRSIDTLKVTSDLAGELGAKEVVLHPGSVYGHPGRALDHFVSNAGQFLTEYGDSGAGIFVETAGKTGQLGSVDEILAMSAALANVHPCIDFGHVHARTLGTLRSSEAVGSVVRQVGNFLLSRPDKRVHFHYTPIHFGPKGEIQHRAINDRRPSADDLFAAHAHPEEGFYHPRVANVAPWLRALSINATVISETHNSQEEGACALRDAVLMRQAA